MENRQDRKNPQTTDQLHPWVYTALAGLGFWLVASAWIFFSQKGYLNLDLAVVSVLVFIVVAIPVMIHLVGQRADRSRSTGHPFGA